MTHAFILGISGYSGSGKTTLIEEALVHLKKDGLSVGVVKHTAHHKLSLETEGKDSARFYRGGADFVFACDAGQAFARYPLEDGDAGHALSRLPVGLDLVLVEGYRALSGIPKVWLEAGTSEIGGPPDGQKPDLVLYRDDPAHTEKLMDYVHRELADYHSRRILRAGLLIGGKSARMGTSKALLRIGTQSLIERSCRVLSGISSGTILLGSGEVPDALASSWRLPDVPGIKGPLSGMLSAFRWDPGSTWIISAVDMPLMTKRAWHWLLRQRRPGVWAILPRLDAKSAAQTTAACYEPMIFDYAEELARKGVSRLQTFASHPKVITPLIPPAIAATWKNVNTAAEWKEALSKLKAR
ncbi:MAG: molybdopterin-guanine dinucleotide biosynthesis protein B [Candidatus Sulfobium sp.]|jgi:molybdopterin-guanine dinucleotide biosynthesis protein MobB